MLAMVSATLEAASQDVCAKDPIKFAEPEPQQFTWFTGRKQTSRMFENGKPIAELELSYRDEPPRQPTMGGKVGAVKILEQRFDYRAVYGNPGFIWSSGEAGGYIIPRRIDQTAAARLIMPARDFAQVIVDFEYDSERVLSRVFVDLYCFMNSPEILKGMK